MILFVFIIYLELYKDGKAKKLTESNIVSCLNLLILKTILLLLKSIKRLLSL